MTAEDHRLLCELDAAGRPDAASEMERLIRRQAEPPADLDHRGREILETDLDAVSIDFIVCARAARWSYGTGGGRHRRPRNPESAGG